MFEKFEIPAIFLAKDAVLSLFSGGRTTGLVVDTGYSGTVISPVSDGWIETRGLTRSIIGGRFMDAYCYHLITNLLQGNAPKPMFRLHKTVTEDGLNVICKPKTNLINVHPSYDTYFNLEIARDIKETVCKMSDTPVVESDLKLNTIPTSCYVLPDGTAVDIAVDRFKVPELLCDVSSLDFNNLPFAPYLIPTQHLSSGTLGAGVGSGSIPSSTTRIPNLICDSVMRCDAELQSTLLSNLIFAGGGSSFDGAADRLKLEVEDIIHPIAPGWRVKTMAVGVAERAVCAWLGGSILASMGSFHEMWMTRQEYLEHGAGLVDRKCP